MQGMRLVLLLMVAVSGAACASGGAHALEDRPTLAVPPVPPRTIEPQPEPELPRVEPIAEANPPAATPPPRRPTTRTSDPRPAEPKPETPPETPAGTGATPVPPPVAPLRTPSAPSGPEAARQVRDTLTRAEGILSKVDYQKLSKDRRSTYDTAKNFIQQSEEKLKQEDLQLALNFALRAETIAQTLQNGGR
jgi:hypothetical protein